jgi:small subunit ribosomal protein S1
MAAQDRLHDPDSAANRDSTESFGDILSQYEQSHSHQSHDDGAGREGTVIAVSTESVFVDIGFKIEGIVPLAAFANAGETVKPGDKVRVSIKGRDPEGYYELSRLKVERPKDWSALEKAFAAKTPIAGVVTGAVKGGLRVDVGVRAFMPASRSGAKDAAEVERLAGHEIRCRIIKLDVADEDVVVDRRVVLEEEERAAKERRYAEIKEGETVKGVVRGLTDFGAFVDLGGIDGLLHIADISWGHLNKSSDALAVGQEIEAKVLKVDPAKRRISLGMKQLLPQPWDSAAERYKVGERARGVVTRLTDFGAFVELEPGVEGLIHLTELSWSKKVRKPADVVKAGESVEVVVLGVNQAERRISLGLKQALGDPWADAARKFPVGSVVEGPVVSLTKFGAFVQLAEGMEGMIHVGDVSAEKRIDHPQEALKIGQSVKAQVLEVDEGKRRLRLGMKQLVPTGLDEYIAEHKEGDVVTGRVTDVSSGRGQVELGEGIQASFTASGDAPTEDTKAATAKPDLSSLSSMLAAKWKGAAAGRGLPAKREPARAGQIRSFRVVKLDADAKKIELELA